MNKYTFQGCIIFLLLFNFISIVLADDLKEKGMGLNTFRCADLKLSDHGMRMDREGYFYNENTGKLLCVAAMGSSSCAAHTKGQECICPPPEWKANGCWKKYSEYRKTITPESRRASYEEWRKKKNSLTPHSSGTTFGSPLI